MNMEPLHQPNNIIAQKYQIINTLGEGGSGITFLAQDLQNNKTVALKALSLHRITDWKAMELFEREAKILAQLNHPAIPQYLEYFDADTDGEKHFYIAQQLAPGKSLAKLVEQNWRTNEQQVRDIAAQTLEILIYLHSLETPVTHRDIKPQNIIRDENGKVFLVDFGAVQDTYYNTFMRGSTVVGTYGYMAPEQFRGQALPATDLYGLGATLLYLLTHRSPADFPTDGLKIDFRDRIKVSNEFAEWLDKMLEPDLEERFSSAKEALEVLRGKRKISLGKQKPMLLKAVVGMVIATAFTVGIFKNYKWPILNTFGIQPSSNICDSPYWIKDYTSKGGNPNSEFRIDGLLSFKKSLLLCAIETNSLETAELLIAKGANVNDELHNVHSVKFAKFLIANGADVNDALHNVQSVKVAKLLIANGADVNHKNELGWTPLHNAAVFYRKDIVELLLSHQADVNARNKAGYTPLNIISGGKSGMGKYIDNPYILRDAYRNNVDQITKKSTIKLLIDNGATFD